MITKQEYDNGITCKKKTCFFCKDWSDCFQVKVNRMALRGCRYTRPVQPSNSPPSKNSIGWCEGNLNLNCKDYGQKCIECINYRKNKEVSYFKSIK